jgi:eukaryotic-like serine/threonine-protein kinase
MAAPGSEWPSGDRVSPEVQRLFEEAAALPDGQRPEYLASQTADAAIHREVLSLLAHDSEAEQFFAGAVDAAASSLERQLDFTPGTRIGAYAITRMLGRGGMGAVYLAERADGAFEQTVAIKVILSANPAEFLLERFQHERQILARLSHPNIARLLDGGEARGVPYFVLEYVRGEEIDRYYGRLRLNLHARLRLFLQVCGAVQYAHENLVVHRDLKPGNILVAEDGNPKLLDFGIAKVLDPAHSGAAHSTRALTPEYASPEQVRGDPITTASDVYSLGAVLYALVTGGPPRVVASLSPLEAARAITEQPAPPAAGVPADIAAILAKALHIDRLRRYHSAGELALDIQRFLDGKPVTAVADSVSYRASRFLRRHWIGALATAAILLALVGGGSVALWQARRAERRFAEVRQLSNRFLFEFEGAIHHVPGATKARQLVIKTAQEYLDRLAAEAGRDRQLIHELADAYKKLADVQGSTVQGNTGDTKAALASYRKALALRDSIDDRQATNVKVRIAYLENLTDLSRLEQQAGDAARALPLAGKAVAAAREWMKTSARDPDFLSMAASSYAGLARAQSEKGDDASALATAKASLRLRQAALDLRPGDLEYVHDVAVGYFSVGSFEKAAGHGAEAAAAYQMSTSLLQKLADADPADGGLQRSLMVASWNWAASTLDMLQQEKKADFAGPVLPLFERVYATANRLLSQDPANALALNDAAGIAVGYGSALEQAGRPAESLAVLMPVIERQKKRVEASPNDRTVSYSLALLHQWAADSHRDRGDLSQALQNRRAAGEVLDRLVAAAPSVVKFQHQKAENLRETGELLAARREYPAARECFSKGLEIAERLPPGPSLLDASELIAKLRTSTARIAGK